jgi:flagellar protein FliS
VVLLYQRLQRDLDEALDAMASRDHERSHFALLHAQEIVAELDTALDPDAWDGAAQLSQLYGYVLELLVDANLRKDPRPVRECIAVIAPVADAWAAAWAQVSTAPAIAGVLHDDRGREDPDPEGPRLLDVTG